MTTKWPFADARKTQFLQRGPILLVMHDQDDGACQFHTGKTVPASDAKVVALDEIIFRDPSIVELADLPRGWSAIRDSITSHWKRQPISSSA
jgi:hypothetical protein